MIVAWSYVQVPNGATSLVNIAFAWGDEGSLAVHVQGGTLTPEQSGASTPQDVASSNGLPPSPEHPPQVGMPKQGSSLRLLTMTAMPQCQPYSTYKAHKGGSSYHEVRWHHFSNNLLSFVNAVK